MGDVTITTVRPVSPATDAAAHSAEASKTTPQRPSQPESQVKVESKEAIQQPDSAAANYNVNLNFSVDKATGRTVIRVIDADTNEVVRQLPPEEILNLSASMEAIAGRLLSIKA